MDKTPLVAIVIVNWNKKEMTGECLRSLKMTDYPNYKIILVDNGSTDGSIEYLKKINPKIEVISLKENLGYTKGTNVGWKYGLEKLKADYICAMDNDIITVQKQWLSLIIDELEKDPIRGIGSGKHLFPDGRLQTPFLEADLNDSNKPDTNKYNFVKEVTGYAGPGIVIKSSVIKKIGYYDENFFYGPNDVDYCNRARKAGFKLVYVGTSVSHHHGSSSGLSPAKDFIYRHQSEGMLIYSFRYDGFIGILAMTMRQLARAFVTRKDPISSRQSANLYFHRTFPKRVGSYMIAFKEAIKNYIAVNQNNVNQFNVK